MIPITRTSVAFFLCLVLLGCGSSTKDSPSQHPVDAPATVQPVDAEAMLSPTDADAVAPTVESDGGTDALATDPRCDPTPHRAAYKACTAATDQTTCEQNGGEWRAMGMLGVPGCFCKTGQDNCPCTVHSQCLGECRYNVDGPEFSTTKGCPKTGACAADNRRSGCFCLYPEDKIWVTCVD